MDFELSETLESYALNQNRYIEIVPRDASEFLVRLPIPM